MTPEQLRYIREEFKNLNDHELLRRVALEESEFLPEAMEIAREQLELRNLRPLDAKEYFAQFPAEDPEFGFCRSCLDRTTAEEPDCFSVRGFGTRLRGYDHECESCGSLLVTKWLCIGFPIRKMESYRVLFKKGSSLIGREVYRRLKESEA
jgi:hypothetical protein